MEQYDFSWENPIDEGIDDDVKHVQGKINNKSFIVSYKFQNEIQKNYKIIYKKPVYNIKADNLTQEEKDIVLFMSLFNEYDEYDKEYSHYPHSIVKTHIKIKNNSPILIELIEDEIFNYHQNVPIIISYQPYIFGEEIIIYSATLFGDIFKVKNEINKITQSLKEEFKEHISIRKTDKINWK